MLQEKCNTGLRMLPPMGRLSGFLRGRGGFLPLPCHRGSSFGRGSLSFRSGGGCREAGKQLPFPGRGGALLHGRGLFFPGRLQMVVGIINRKKAFPADEKM